MTKRPPGKAPDPNALRRTGISFHIRLTPTDARRIRELAKRHGLSVTDLIRRWISHG